MEYLVMSELGNLKVAETDLLRAKECAKSMRDRFGQEVAVYALLWSTDEE